MKRRAQFEFPASYDYPFLVNDTVNIEKFLTTPASFRAFNRRIVAEQLHQSSMLGHGGTMITDPTIIGPKSDAHGFVRPAAAAASVGVRRAPPAYVPPPPPPPPPRSAVQLAVDAQMTRLLDDVSRLAAEYESILGSFDGAEDIPVADRGFLMKTIVSRTQNAEGRFRELFARLYDVGGFTFEGVDQVLNDYLLVAMGQISGTYVQITKELRALNKLFLTRGELVEKNAVLQNIGEETDAQIADDQSARRNEFKDVPSARKMPVISAVHDDSAPSFIASQSQQVDRPQRKRQQTEFFRAKSRKN